ncbi:tyrosine-protein phosphatase [Amnibacterium kyonggiense]|uniref:Tyrosine phosphatase family protein n=1 Tax=Amnibacterium kyonggiense TaxID=595671 RepID=A0A4R7FE47_9MICO|nr:tyrosine-protein phosphatase [Amnibacterium kyonggiense]TDS75599.1 tyrosine phosphatase family protein [Amnibacterium kyonggiense]
MTSEPRAVVVDGLVNARDLGGLPLVGGGETPRGVFLRSERPDRVDADGWAALHDRGLRAVLDLRQPEERDGHPARIPEGIADLHVDHDGLRDHPTFWAHYWENGLVGTPLYYLPHLAALPERTVDVLAALATAPEGAVLFHCAGGRDRTGLIAAILLTIAGVEPDAILEDYLETITNAEAMAAGQGRPSGEPAVAALLDSLGTTSEEAFRAFLAGLDVEALLAALPAEQATALRTWRGRLPQP